MPEQCIITGTVSLEGAERGGTKVQAVDRDLPSRERCAGSPPQMLGEGIADAEGQCHNLERLSWFAERATGHQWRVLQLVPYWRTVLLQAVNKQITTSRDS